MKRFSLVFAALFVAGMAAEVAAQSTTQSVTLEVAAINEIAVTGTPSLTVNSATAGSAPDAATASVTWAITTNESNKKVTAAIDLAMPAGVTFSANMTAPTGGTSAGAVSLGTTAQDLVTGISTLNESGLTLTYTLSATSAAGTMASTTRTVTYTIAAGV